MRLFRTLAAAALVAGSVVAAPALAGDGAFVTPGATALSLAGPAVASGPAPDAMLNKGDTAMLPNGPTAIQLGGAPTGRSFALPTYNTPGMGLGQG
jgi:hypothetical protein